MPNFVTNLVTFEGDENEIKALLESIKADDGKYGSIDFNKIIPMPESLNIECGSSTDRGKKMVLDFMVDKMLKTGIVNPTDEIVKKWQEEHKETLSEDDLKDWQLGVQAINNVKDYGYPTWYEWHINNWGTKWNADSTVSPLVDDNKIYFLTAWAAPHKVIDKLAKMHPDIEIQHVWADEDFGQNCGGCEYKNGIPTYHYPQTDKEGYEFAAQVMNCDLEEMGLRLNASGTNYVWCNFEDYEVVKVMGEYALFSDERLTDDDIPFGFYRYDVRKCFDDIYSIENSVKANFVGCLITNEPIEFFGENYVLFDSDSFIRPEEAQFISFNDYVDENFCFDNFENDEGMGGME